MLAIAATAKLYMPHIMYAWPIVLHTQVLWVKCVLNTPTGIYSEGLLQTTTPQTWGIHSVSDWLHQQVQRSCDFLQDHHQTGKPEIMVSPPTVDVTYNNCCICKALSTADNPSHPSTHLTPLTPLLISPISWTIHPPAIRQKVQEHPNHHQTPKQFLPWGSLIAQHSADS